METICIHVEFWQDVVIQAIPIRLDCIYGNICILCPIWSTPAILIYAPAVLCCGPLIEEGATH